MWEKIGRAFRRARRWWTIDDFEMNIECSCEDPEGILWVWGRKNLRKTPKVHIGPQTRGSMSKATLGDHRVDKSQQKTIVPLNTLVILGTCNFGSDHSLAPYEYKRTRVPRDLWQSGLHLLQFENIASQISIASKCMWFVTISASSCIWKCSLQHWRIKEKLIETTRCMQLFLFGKVCVLHIYTWPRIT